MDSTIQQYKPQKLLSALNACIVDNEKSYLDDFVTSLLPGQFKRLIPTTSAEEAIDLATSGRIDVLICDFKMPKKDGITILEHCKRENPAIISILNTGFSLTQSELTRCKKIGIEKVSKLEQEHIDSLMNVISFKANEVNGFDENNFISYKIEKKDLLTKIIKTATDKSLNKSTESAKENDRSINHDLMTLFRELSQILINKYKKIKNVQDIVIMSSPDESTTLNDLIKDLEEMTPKGRHHLELWLKVNTTDHASETNAFFK